MNVTTKEGVEVRPGQVWRDLDKRMGDRRCKVLGVEVQSYGSGFHRKRVTVAMMARCLSDGSVGHRRRAVQIARMHKGSSGWALVE
ncbi:MAG: hypothetical protein INR62_02705 [Rhodospirillales bacterium]|nr:hypothetical protein [Acetobacter sp.]